ncbi:hypothetical protein BN2537_2479 [Streptomyces venezuelae]|nr:hypothetical protein BN2537_2479 [Streptomyces venezuelae]
MGAHGGVLRFVSRGCGAGVRERVTGSVTRSRLSGQFRAEVTG